MNECMLSRKNKAWNKQDISLTLPSFFFGQAQPLLFAFFNIPADMHTVCNNIRCMLVFCLLTLLLHYLINSNQKAVLKM